MTTCTSRTTSSKPVSQESTKCSRARQESSVTSATTCTSKTTSSEPVLPESTKCSRAAQGTQSLCKPPPSLCYQSRQHVVGQDKVLKVCVTKVAHDRVTESLQVSIVGLAEQYEKSSMTSSSQPNPKVLDDHVCGDSKCVPAHTSGHWGAPFI